MSRVYRRANAWWIDFNDASGRRRRKKVGTDRRVAQEALNAVLTKVARKEWVGIVEDSKISFAAFADIWRARRRPDLSPRTAERWDGILRNHLLPEFRGSLRSIELGAVDSYVARRAKAGATIATINRELSLLRHILRRAVAWKEDGIPYLKHYPLQDLKLTKEHNKRVRFLDNGELPRLLAACNESRSPWLTPFVLFALNTGCRRGEILGLTRRSIDWAQRTLKLAITKNGEPRVVYLNDTALAALRSLPVPISDATPLFPLADAATISRSFRRACRRASIPDFKLHDMRHHFASAQAMNGTPMRALQELLGHRDTRMTMRYSHISDRYLHTAVDAVNIDARSALPHAPKRV